MIHDGIRDEVFKFGVLRSAFWIVPRGRAATRGASLTLRLRMGVLGLTAGLAWRLSGNLGRARKVIARLESRPACRARWVREAQTKPKAWRSRVN